MRESVGIPAGVLAYSTSLILLLLAVKMVVAVPQDWSNLITITTAIVAFRVTCAVVRVFSTELGVKIVGAMIAIFWLISLGFDTLGLFERALDFISGDDETARGLGGLRDLIELVWDSRICAGVSAILAIWTLTK